MKRIYLKGLGLFIVTALSIFSISYFKNSQIMNHLDQEKECIAREESFQGKIANRLDCDQIHDFVNFINEALIACQIPGAAIGIVQDGKIILEQGFGVRNLDTQEKTTSETLFR